MKNTLKSPLLWSVVGVSMDTFICFRQVSGQRLQATVGCSTLKQGLENWAYG